MCLQNTFIVILCPCLGAVLLLCYYLNFESGSSLWFDVFFTGHPWNF